jgi:hypothetical protein
MSFRIDGTVQPGMGTQFQNEHEPAIDRHLRLFLAIQVVPAPPGARLHRVAADKEGNVLEGAEIHVGVNAPIAGTSQRRLDGTAAQMREAGPFQQPGEIAQQIVEARLPLFRSQRQERRRIVVGVER